VVVPAGALASSVDIAIARSGAGAPALGAGITAAGAIFALTPHGTTFTTPVTVTIPFDPAQVPDGKTPVLYQAEQGGSFAPIASTVQGQTLVAQLSGFSYVVPAIPSVLQATAITDRCLREALTGQIWCWGDQGDIAYGSGLVAGTGNYDTDFAEPVRLPPRGFGEVVGGNGYYVCGITNGFEVWCIGDPMITRASGLDPLPDRTWVKIVMPPGVDLYRLSGGGATVCGIGSPTSTDQTAVGKVFCWGNDLRGQLGRGPAADPNVVAAVSGTGVYAYVAVGGGFACASQEFAGAQTVGAVDCWGDNSYSELSPDSGLGYSDVPLSRGVVVATRPGALTAAGWTGCGVQNDGTGYCWGDNDYGERGDGTAGTGNFGQNFYAPKPVVGHKWKTIAPTSYTTCGLDDAGVAYCWGDATNGSLGNGQDTVTGGKQVTPAQVAGPISFVELDGSLCGRTAAGEVYCWGTNRFYDLGLGQLTPEFSNVPVRVKAEGLSKAMP
jgi:alpha-tubulin suppressor-like RCC1 family protein